MEKFSDIKELDLFYNKFRGKSLDELYKYVNSKYPNIKLKTNKGIVGQVLEALIGNAPNSDPNPDVNNIKVELKVLPLRKISGQIQPKERSKIKSLNYNEIIKEKWDTCAVKGKMETILFLMYEQPTGKTYEDWIEFQFKGTLLYQLKNEQPSVVKNDWEGIKLKVKKEIADQISEGDSKILGACTSGSGKLVVYGNKNNKAKQRSYSLKHNFLKHYYNSNKRNIKYSSLKIDKGIKPEDYVINELNKELLGKNLKSVVSKHKVEFSTKAKSSFSILINRILKLEDKNRIKELEENGIIIKTIPINPANNKPWESMSFPKFSLVDLIDEEWDGENEAVFKNVITQGFIFIPIIKEKEKYIIEGKTKYRFKDWTTWEGGNTVYWKANDTEIELVKKEWKKAKNIVEKGVVVWSKKHGKGMRQENNLLKSSQTTMIHIRPHANNSKDIDSPYSNYTNNKIKISWQSFWLNKEYVNSILNT